MLLNFESDKAPNFSMSLSLSPPVQNSPCGLKEQIGENATGLEHDYLLGTTRADYIALLIQWHKEERVEKAEEWQKVAHCP